MARRLSDRPPDNVVAFGRVAMSTDVLRPDGGPAEEPGGEAGSALFARCRAGDPAALADLYKGYRREAMHYIRNAVRNAHEAEDILQEVFLEVARSVRRFEGRSSFSVWLRRVCVRTAVRQMKRRHRQIGEESADVDRRAEGPAAGVLPDARIEARDRRARIRALVDTLSPKKRMVLVLHDLEGTSPAEIANLVGAPVLTVRTRLFYARRELAALAAQDPALADYFVPGALR